MVQDGKNLLDTGHRLLESGDLAGAAGAFREVLTIMPGEPQALSMLALIAQQTGRGALALELTAAALQAAPGQAALWANYASLQRQMECGDPRAAAAEALRLDPALPQALDIAGYLAREAGDVTLACDLHARAAAALPRDSRMQGNYALALIAAHELDAAQAAARAALAAAPQSPFALMVSGLALRAAGDARAAAEYFEQAATLAPDYHDAAMQAAQARLATGDWDKGWAWWEKRRTDTARFAGVKRWQGARTGHLIAHAEQGFGDTIQCLRWVPKLQAMAARVTLQVPAALRSLAAAHLPGVALSAPDDALPGADAHVPLMSLPYLLGIRPDEVSQPLALQADAGMQAVWRERLAGLRRPRIGFVPGGNPGHANDRNRSLPADIAARFAADFTGQISVLQRDGRIVTAGDAIKPADFMNTAAWMAALDIIVTVDTSAVHLAGSLGRPTLLLLPFDPEWRWFYGHTATIWYPSVRIFRQERPGDWDGVMTAVKAVIAG